MNEIVTKKGVFECFVHGEGEPLIMLRGLGRTVRHWAGFEKMIARHFRVFTFDLRGIDTNRIPAKLSTSVYDLAEDVIALMDHHKLKKAHLLGVSLGGMVALAAGISYPERIRSLIIVNSSIAGQGVLRLTPEALASISSAAWDQAGMERRLIDVLTGPDITPDRKQEIVQLYDEIKADLGMNAKTVAIQLASAARFFAGKKLKKLTVPTLVIYGSHDKFVPAINSKRIAALIPDAKILELKNAGHEAHLDKPDDFIKAVIDWRDQLQKQQGN